MVKITFLGTASAVPSKDQHNTHMIFESDSHVVMVDCGGNPIVRLGQAGIDPLSITELILTHFHPDHVSGMPLLLMDMWLMGRKNKLVVYGLEDVLDRAKQMMALFDWQDWGGFYPLQFFPLNGPAQMTLVDTDRLTMTASPVCHMIPGIGIKLIFPEATICYSSDTGPCEDLVQLAKGADILIHEASGEYHGHSSPEQAGMVAKQAGVGTLYLIHYPPNSNSETLINRAKTNFSGDVIVAEDLMKVTLP